MTIQECYKKMGADYEDVLKRVCQNLGFTNLYQPTYELTEVLRAGTLEGSKEWFDRVTEQYNITIDAIRAVQ